MTTLSTPPNAVTATAATPVKTTRNRTKKVPVSPNNVDADGNLLLSVGARLKLTQDQQDALRRSFNEKLSQPTNTTRHGITTVTHQVSNLEAELGMDRLTFASLVSSRESHPLPLVLRLQRVLEVELVSEDQILAAASSYVDHLRTNYW
jgi:hypothetical protein